jgi:hypothetical protein
MKTSINLSHTRAILPSSTPSFSSSLIAAGSDEPENDNFSPSQSLGTVVVPPTAATREDFRRLADLTGKLQPGIS